MFLLTGFQPDESMYCMLLIREKIVLTFITNTLLLFHEPVNLRLIKAVGRPKFEYSKIINLVRRLNRNCE